MPSARCCTASVGSTPLASDGAGGRSNRSVSSAKPLIAILSSCAARTTKCDMSRLEQQAKDHARLAHLARPMASRVATAVQPPNGELELHNKELQEQLKVAQSAIVALTATQAAGAPAAPEQVRFQAPSPPQITPLALPPAVGQQLMAPIQDGSPAPWATQLLQAPHARPLAPQGTHL